MAEKNETTQQRSKRKRRSNTPIIYFFVILGVVVSFFLYFLYLEKSAINPPPEGEQKIQADSGGSPTQTESSTSGIEQENTASRTLQNSALQDGRQGVDAGESADGPISSTTPPPTVPGSDDSQTDFCKTSLATIENFYHHLDQQEYLKPYQLSHPSDVYFSSLIQKVVDNPPIVTGETDDLFNILKNTAHFFRIVGKKNIFVLKAILDREKDSFENVLAEFYRLTSQPECLQQGFSLDIKEEALYDYAGFFLNTMGGRLYLFRRDSVSRMAVSYYSILIVDNANRKGTNKHGIDLVPAINTLIPELENSGSQLRLKDDYLDTLYDLKEKYM